MVAIDVRAEQPLEASTVVVYNKFAPESVELARFYAKQRGIAADHLVGLNCSFNEEISREEYDANIADPLRDAFKTHGWWVLRENPEHETVVMSTSIRFVAVIRGVPLKIKAAPVPYAGDERGGGPIADRNEASVDSELAVLGYFTRQISGVLANPYFQRFEPITNLDNPALLLVCRLDAPTPATVRRMITDSIAAEKNGLWGRAYVDGANNSAPGFKMADDWLAEIPQQLHKVGVPVVYDNSPAIFPDGYPMTDCALYYGWYAGNIAGPFNQPGFRFVPGAIAVHIHSFSAATLRDPNANWVGPLIARGAAASMGNVYEPYLQLTSRLNIFNDRLLHGFTFAESAYSSIEALSWMSVMVGDPLYRPYKNWIQVDSDSARTNSWKYYHEFAARNFSSSSTQYRSLARQAASRTRNGPMLEDLGLTEAGDGDFAAATNSFGQARACYSARDDILRVILEEADAWNKLKKPKRGLDLVRPALRIAGDAPSAPLLRNLEQELRGIAATPGSSPKPTPRVRVRF
jgi:uncharacterized protein (TIGR03790 family)